MKFTHLQVRSGYSFSKSTIQINELVQRAKELNYTALALTDENVMYGVIPFYQQCIKSGIKPIIGLTLTIINKKNEIIEKCILLAKNNQGYKALLKISSEININKCIGIYFDTLSRLSEELICILKPSSDGMISTYLANDNLSISRKYLKRWTDIFQDDFYFGKQLNVLHSAAEKTLDLLLEQILVKQIALHDVRYVFQDEYLAYDCLRAMEDGEVWTGKNVASTSKGKHLISVDEASQLFDEQELQMTQEIVAKCNVEIEFNTFLIPSYPLDEGVEAGVYLSELCWKLVKEKYEVITAEVKQRLSYELRVIKQLKFSDYFLIVWDYVRFAKSKDILVGPGRGSAAGSIVSYILGITNVDPLKYDLLFERFLNPDRQSLPDIDIDFLDYRRDEVIEYVREKYGNEFVGQIITFGTFAARSTIRELIKTMEIDQRDASYILNKFRNSSETEIREIVKNSSELKAYIKQSKQLQLLFKIALNLEGLPRHASTHAAGVIISATKLVEHVPLTVGASNTLLTQYPMGDLEKLGLLKMDFLGLRNLTLIERIIKAIEFNTKEKIDLENIPFDDPAVFRLLQKGLTNGIFQLESAGMKRVLMDLKPSTFFDIVAVSALYRPGPMKNIPIYIQRKHSKHPIQNLHPDVAAILKDTYGVLVYQEQIMAIAHKIAGYSLGEADIFRRAVSKKEIKVINNQEYKFIAGCKEKGYEEQMAKELFQWIVKFSNYGFNKSHAVAYSKISYQLAYLKTHYPAFFYTELLNGVLNQQDKTAEYMKEVKLAKIKILPPSVNKSIGYYKVEAKSIRMGLQSIKGIGYQSVNDLLEKRGNQPFQSLFDFCLRTTLKIWNRTLIESLIKVGAFDEIYPNRAGLLATLDQAIEQGELFGGLSHSNNGLTNQIGLKDEYLKIEEMPVIEKLQFEKELLGHYVSEHPVANERKKLKLNGILSLTEASQKQNSRNLRAVVFILEVKEIRTKRGDPMAFIVISDETKEMQAVIFPELYREKKKIIQPGKILMIDGSIEKRNHMLQWVFQNVFEYESDKLPLQGRLFIQINENKRSKIKNLQSLAEIHPGNIIIIFYDAVSKKTSVLKKPYYIKVNDDIMKKLVGMFGENNVVFEQL